MKTRLSNDREPTRLVDDVYESATSGERESRERVLCEGLVDGFEG